MFLSATRTIILFFTLALLVPGCARLFVPDMPAQKTAPAEIQLSRIEQINDAIPPYKGIGELYFVSGGEARSIRGAWLGVPNRKLRIETIGLAGMPGARLICDGKECHFIYFESGCYRKHSSRATNLRQLAGIDMEVADLVVLLGGGIPIAPHDTAWMEDSGNSSRPVMKLNRRFYGVVEKIYFSSDTAVVSMVEVFGFKDLKYRVQIVSTRVVDGYMVPDVLEIENEAASMTLKVERAWFDVSYSPEAFVPQLPENNRCD